jgi:hypothetical protein
MTLPPMASAAQSSPGAAGTQSAARALRRARQSRRHAEEET